MELYMASRMMKISHLQLFLIVKLPDFEGFTLSEERDEVVEGEFVFWTQFLFLIRFRYLRFCHLTLGFYEGYSEY